MRTISTALAAHIAGEVTTLAMCWKLTPRAGIPMGFTTHDRDLVFGGVTYQAETGFFPTAVESRSGFAVDNTEIEGMLSASSLDEVDIAAGVYDYAGVEVFLLNYTDVSQGALMLRRGWLGEVSYSKHAFTAEVRGMTQLLAQNIGELFSPSCRATLGDARCKVNLATHTVTGSVTTAISTREFRDTARTEASGIFTGGIITFTSGTLSGVKMEVKEYTHSTTTGGYIQLVLPLPYTLSAGDAYSLIKGCDKTIGTCKARFNNVLNFRGEPHVPGIDRMLETAGTRGIA